MEFSKKTSIGVRRSLFSVLIKGTLILVIIGTGIILLSKINFPSPNKEIQKIIKNEQLKIVK
tara:strand:- start:680 stop:865 length:186 start_codon:yes stop_codon:yes gene_type:complete